MTHVKMEAKLDYEPESVTGKGVLITGGTTGIGRATAMLLAAEGARVFTFGRHEKELREAMADFQEVGEVTGTVADSSRAEDVQRVFEEAEDKLGQIDVLVNNAALAAQGVEDTTVEECEYVVKTNLVGYIACAQQFVKRMKGREGGHIVNVGSMSADVREKGSSVYVATKAGLQGFSEALRKEVNRFGIKVSLIEPGAVGTDMQPVSAAEQREKERDTEMLKAEDIAQCIHFCLIQPKRCDVVGIQVRPHRQEI